MKKIILTVGSFLAISTLSAQISVNESSEKFSTGSQNALSTTITENTKDAVESKWKSVLKDFKNESVKAGKKEMFADNVVISEWGNNPVDIYTTFEEDKKKKIVVMHVAYDLGGVYLKSSEQKDKYTQAEKMIKEFAVKITKEAITDKLKDEEKKLSRAEDDQKDLEKKNTNLKKDIAEYESKIADSKREIVVLENDIIKKKSEVEIQKKVVDASSGATSEQTKSANKIYEKLTGQYQDLEKKKKNETNDINDRTKKIAKAKEEIVKNESEQVKKKAEIEAQKRTVEDTKSSLNKVN